MNKIFASIILLVILSIPCVNATISNNKNSNDNQIQSTQGLEVSDSIKNNFSIKTDNEIKQIRKNRKKFLKNISKIENYHDKKRIKKRDKELLETRLEKKKHDIQMLEVSSNITNEKGEIEK